MTREQAEAGIKYFLKEKGGDYSKLPKITKEEVSAVILLIKSGLISEEEPLGVWGITLNGGLEWRDEV